MFQVKNKCYISGDIFLFWWSLELHTPSKPATSGLPFAFIKLSTTFEAHSGLAGSGGHWSSRPRASLPRVACHFPL